MRLLVFGQLQGTGQRGAHLRRGVRDLSWLEPDHVFDRDAGQRRRLRAAQIGHPAG
ncbi:hypothetical protein GCM10010376_89690 [Streptomyces violaceusniger]